jgi:nitroreductase
VNTTEVIRRRISANRFDTQRSLAAEEIRELVESATHAPSSYNIQHWRFVAVTRPEDKERLKAVAYGQQKVADAAVTFIVLGDLEGHTKLDDILQRAEKEGIVDASMRGAWVAQATSHYTKPQNARDEAIRSAAMAAMLLMLAAGERGLVSGPMGGFDPEGVKREFKISDRYVPVMLVTVGYEAEGNWPRKPRLSVDEVLAFHNGEALK